MLKRTNERFEVVDYYDFREVLYIGDSIESAYIAACQRIDDTDGECDVTILDYNRSIGNLAIFAEGEDGE